MKRALLLLVAAGISIVGTAAAAPIQQLTLTLTAADGGAEAGGGTFTFDNATSKLEGTVTHTVAAADTSFLTVTPPSGADRLIDTYSGTSPITVSAVIDAGDIPSVFIGKLSFTVQAPGPENYTGALVMVQSSGDAGTIDAGNDGGPTTQPSPNPKYADDAGTAATPGGSSDGGGCSATSAPTGAGAIGLALSVLALAFASRRRTRR